MKAEKFTLEITLGNDAMCTWDDIVDALQKVAGRLVGQDEPESGDSNSIYDTNGNRVGAWRTK